jgi:hypothetical protein
MSDDPTYLAQLQPLLDGMRKAGVPEQQPLPAAALQLRSGVQEHTPNLPAV